jgi:hypothetical protein
MTKHREKSHQTALYRIIAQNIDRRKLNILNIQFNILSNDTIKC